MHQQRGSAQRGDDVVVGIGGAGSRSALLWGVEEAVRRDVDLRLVHAYPPDVARTDLGVVAALRPVRPLPSEQQLLHDARSRLGLAAEVVQRREPGLHVHELAVRGVAARVLLDQVATSTCLVIGRSVHDPTERWLTATSELSGRARGPVVVVPDHRSSWLGHVVVGIGDEDRDDAAMSFAAEHAARHGTSVVALHAWQLEPGATAEQNAATGTRRRRALHERMDRWRARHPHVPMRLEVVSGRPVEALRAAGGDACLLVVGSRQRGLVRSYLLGSVGHELSQSCLVPVAVIHHDAARDGRRVDGPTLVSADGTAAGG